MSPALDGNGGGGAKKSFSSNGKIFLARSQKSLTAMGQIFYPLLFYKLCRLGNTKKLFLHSKCHTDPIPFDICVSAPIDIPV